MNKIFPSLLLFLSFSIRAQNWTLKLSSNVEIRTWKLTTKADKTEKELAGASIKLYKGSSIVTEMSTNASGDFTILVPGDGEFILEVSYSSCNAKRFLIDTRNVPEDVAKDNFKPTFSIIGGFVMAKPFPGIDYSGLKQNLVKVEYKNKLKNFDHDDHITENGIDIVSKIADAENTLINNFCSTNKAGDVALAKPDCPLAKQLYEKAIAMIPGEPYPVEQLAKVGQCLKDREEAARKAEEEKAKKAEADKLAKEKAEEEKAKKAEADKLAKEKAAENKALADKAAIEKAEADKAAKEKANAEKTAKENAAAEKKAADKAAKEKAVTDKQAAEKSAKENAAAEKTKQKEAEKAKQKEVAANEDESKRRKADSQGASSTFSGQPGGDDGGKQSPKGDSKYRIPQVLGASKYKDAITKANDYFKTKRYSEAKAAYEEALAQKAGDAYAQQRIQQCNDLLNAKK